MGSVLETTATDADGGAQSPAFWNDYMTLMEGYSDRWVDCLRGDMVASFDLPEGGSFLFTEAFGMNGGETCQNLVSEMGEELARAVDENEELSNVYAVEKGPKIGDSKAVVLTFDMAKMVEQMGTTVDQQGQEMMKSLYGETMTGVISTVDDVVIAAGGQNATDLLRGLVKSLKAPGTMPSFAPLDVGPGLMMGINLGEILTWVKSLAPEEAEDIEKAAAGLSGEAGRIPMAMTFVDEMASFEMAVSLKTISTISAIAEEQKAKRAKAAAEEPEAEMYEETD